MSRIKTRKTLNTIALVHLLTNDRLSGITKMFTADYNVLQLNHKMLEMLKYSSRKRKIVFHANIWIRLLPESDTTIWPLLKTTAEYGLLSSPNLLPFKPNFRTNVPSSSKTCTL